jgi:hypothetical protein
MLMGKDNREKFLRNYANLPLAVRKEIVLVLEEEGVKQPITWEVAYLEVSGHSASGEKILAKLEELNLI